MGMSEDLNEKEVILDDEDEKETIEVDLEESGLSDITGAGSIEEKIEGVSSRLMDLEEEKDEILRRLSMAIGDSRLAMENADRSMKDMRRLKKESKNSITIALSRLDNFAQEISKTVEALKKYEELGPPVKELQERLAILEELHNKLEKEKETLSQDLGNFEKEAVELREAIEKLTGRLDVSALDSEALKDKFTEVDDIRNRISSLESALETEIRMKIDELQGGLKFEEIEGVKEIFKTINDLKESFTGNFQSTEDRMEEIKALLALNMDNLELKFKGFREDIYSTVCQIDEKTGECIDKKMTEFEQKSEVVQKLQEDFTSLANEVKADITDLKKAQEIIYEISGKMTRLDDTSDSIKRLEEDMIHFKEEQHKRITEVSEELKQNLLDDRNVREIVGQIQEVLQERVHSVENGLTEIKDKIEKEFREKLDPVVESVNELAGNLDKKLEPFREEINSAKSHLEEELIKVKESWEKLDKAVSDSDGAMVIAQKARESLERMEEEIKAALSKVDALMSTLNETTFKSDVNKEKIDLTIKLIDEARERVKGIQAPVQVAMPGAGAIAPITGELILTRDEIIKAPDTTDLGFELDDLLQVMIKHEASDLHLKSGSPPTVRMDGELIPVGSQVLNDEECKKLVLSAMNAAQRGLMAQRLEVDFAYAIPDARFRVNAFLQKQSISASFRLLRTVIPTVEELHLPEVLKKLCDYSHGLILITGPAGCGKSTTLAAMVNYINENKKLHIVTIEDPIEFIHQDKLSIITQREIGTDTESFPVALKQSLRQDPNVILIGEMRDPETIMTAAIAAETGHLVLSTLHTPNTIQAINRIIDVFSGDTQKQFRLLLSNTLRGIVSQRLLTRIDETGRIPAVEVLVATPTISSLILEEKTGDIYSHMAQGQTDGMQTFTNSLTELYEQGIVSKEEAMYHSDQPTEFRLAIEGHTTGTSTIQEDSLMSWL